MSEEGCTNRKQLPEAAALIARKEVAQRSSVEVLFRIDLLQGGGLVDMHLPRPNPANAIPCFQQSVVEIVVLASDEALVVSSVRTDDCGSAEPSRRIPVV